MANYNNLEYTEVNILQLVIKVEFEESSNDKMEPSSIDFVAHAERFS